MERHYGMDWLRIGAFQLLILYHIGMAFVPWDYPVKVVAPINWLTIPMLLTNPWRLSLLFAVSGYASAALVARNRGSIRGFLISRAARLGVPLLFGTVILVAPQPWVWLVTHYKYSHSFGWFLLHDYYRPHFDHDVAMPTWMHLWFVAYLLLYTLLLCGLLALPDGWRSAMRRHAEAILASPVLLPLPIAFVYFGRQVLPPGWQDSHTLFNDFSAHAVYLPTFLFGYLLRGSAGLQAAVGGWWKVAAVLAICGWIALACLELGWPGNTPLPQELWPVSRLARATEGWAAVVALLGLADRHWNRNSKWRPVLVEAVFPFYLIHQTIIIVVAYWLVPSGIGALGCFLILLAATVIGCSIFYLAGREVGWLRPFIGLRRQEAGRLKPARTVTQT